MQSTHTQAQRQTQIREDNSVKNNLCNRELIYPIISIA